MHSDDDDDGPAIIPNRKRKALVNTMSSSQPSMAPIIREPDPRRNERFRSRSSSLEDHIMPSVDRYQSQPVKRKERARKQTVPNRRVSTQSLLKDAHTKGAGTSSAAGPAPNRVKKKGLRKTANLIVPPKKKEVIELTDSEADRPRLARAGSVILVSSGSDEDRPPLKRARTSSRAAPIDKAVISLESSGEENPDEHVNHDLPLFRSLSPMHDDHWNINSPVAQAQQHSAHLDPASPANDILPEVRSAPVPRRSNFLPAASSPRDSGGAHSTNLINSQPLPVRPPTASLSTIHPSTQPITGANQPRLRINQVQVKGTLCNAGGKNSFYSRVFASTSALQSRTTSSSFSSTPADGSENSSSSQFKPRPRPTQVPRPDYSPTTTPIVVAQSPSQPSAYNGSQLDSPISVKALALDKGSGITSLSREISRLSVTPVKATVVLPPSQARIPAGEGTTIQEPIVRYGETELDDMLPGSPMDADDVEMPAGDHLEELRRDGDDDVHSTHSSQLYASFVSHKSPTLPLLPNISPRQSLSLAQVSSVVSQTHVVEHVSESRSPELTYPPTPGTRSFALADESDALSPPATEELVGEMTFDELTPDDLPEDATDSMLPPPEGMLIENEGAHESATPSRELDESVPEKPQQVQYVPTVPTNAENAAAPTSTSTGTAFLSCISDTSHANLQRNTSLQQSLDATVDNSNRKVAGVTSGAQQRSTTLIEVINQARAQHVARERRRKDSEAAAGSRLLTETVLNNKVGVVSTDGNLKGLGVNMKLEGIDIGKSTGAAIGSNGGPMKDFIDLTGDDDDDDDVVAPPHPPITNEHDPGLAIFKELMRASQSAQPDRPSGSRPVTAQQTSPRSVPPRMKTPFISLSHPPRSLKSMRKDPSSTMSPHFNFTTQQRTGPEIRRKRSSESFPAVSAPGSRKQPLGFTTPRSDNPLRSAASSISSSPGLSFVQSTLARAKLSHDDNPSPSRHAVNFTPTPRTLHDGDEDAVMDDETKIMQAMQDFINPEHLMDPPVAEDVIPETEKNCAPEQPGNDDQAHIQPHVAEVEVPLSTIRGVAERSTLEAPPTIWDDEDGEYTNGNQQQQRSPSAGSRSGASSEGEVDKLIQPDSFDAEISDDANIHTNGTTSSSESSTKPESSRRTSRSSRTSPVNPTATLGTLNTFDFFDKNAAPRMLAGHIVFRWETCAQYAKQGPPTYYLSKDIPHALEDRMNALGEEYRNSEQARIIFEAAIAENTDDEPNAPEIQIRNDVDDEATPPWEFHYSNRMWYGEGIPPPDIKNLSSCNCVGGCNPKSKTCACLKKQREWLDKYRKKAVGFLYDDKGRLQMHGYPIFECNAFCGCDEDCMNRVVQNGRKCLVDIVKTEHKGWGVFAGVKKIPKGTYIGIYAGELITEQEGEMRGKVYNKVGRTYLFDVDCSHIKGNFNTSDDAPEWENMYVVDAYHAGNLTRFLNHSCNPNCTIVACYINEANIQKPLLTVFTSRDVEPWEELCFSYGGDDLDEEKMKELLKDDAVYGRCYCGAAKCRGRVFA